MNTLFHLDTFSTYFSSFQIILVGILLILGLYQIYHFTRVGKGWNKR